MLVGNVVTESYKDEYSKPSAWPSFCELDAVVIKGLIASCERIVKNTLATASVSLLVRSYAVMP